MNPAFAWTVSELIAATGGSLLAGPEKLAGLGVTIDSRRVGPGMLFVAICGRRHDGHTFIDRALEAGALAVVMDRDKQAGLEKTMGRFPEAAWIGVADTTAALGDLARFHRLRFGLPLVALTGSSGKTTTRRLAAAVLATRFNVLATAGNFNNEIGLPLTLFGLSPGHRVAVVELGMNHAGEIDRLADICRPTIGLITNVGTAHVGLLGSVEAVAEAKAELIAHLPEDGHLVLNADDRRVAAMAGRAGCRVTFFGTSAGSDVRAEEIRPEEGKTAFRLCLPSASLEVRLKMPGKTAVSNALAAAAIGHILGLKAGEIAGGLEAAEPVTGRMVLRKTARGVVVLDDTYNANPESTEAALDTLKQIAAGNRCHAVLGDMLELGEHSAALHRRVGRFAAGCGIDSLFATGQMAGELADGALAGGMPPEAVTCGSKQEVTACLLDRLEGCDFVLVKGSRAMAMETVVEKIVTACGGAEQ